MSAPIISYTVDTIESTSPVTVSAQYFTTEGGILVFFSERNQTVAAFAPGSWTSVQPVVTQ